MSEGWSYWEGELLNIFCWLAMMNQEENETKIISIWITFVLLIVIVNQLTHWSIIDFVDHSTSDEAKSIINRKWEKANDKDKERERETR